MAQHLRFEGLHELEITSNEKWESWQVQWLTPGKQYSVLNFGFDFYPAAETAACVELQSFLRYTIFRQERWRPATNTSAIITLLPGPDKIRRRYWVNGTLIGMKGPDSTIREACLMIERYSRFPTMYSLEEYIRSRIPYERATNEEIRCIASQLNHRFVLVGRHDVYDFRLRRKVKKQSRCGKKLILIILRWDIPHEAWGFSTWKGYFKIDVSGRVTFQNSRVSCHVDMQTWLAGEFPRPWTFPLLERPHQPPADHLGWANGAFTWLQICDDLALRRRGVIVAVEDDPVTGMPEDMSDGVSFERLSDYLEFRPPENVGCTPQSFWVND
jgi:hypothetical protein